MKNIRAATKDLEIRKDKAMKRSETDDLWTKVESPSMDLVCYICHKKWKND
jgi:hypothetical protein